MSLKMWIHGRSSDTSHFMFKCFRKTVLSTAAGSSTVRQFPCWCSSGVAEGQGGKEGRREGRSLCGERNPPGVGDLTFLQVLHQLGQPAFGGGVVLQDLSEGGVFELVGEALPQSFSGSGVV